MTNHLGHEDHEYALKALDGFKFNDEKGEKYGKPIWHNDIVTIILDRIEGTLSFKINGKD